MTLVLILSHALALAVGIIIGDVLVNRAWLRQVKADWIGDDK